jgi:hypothetical protein
VESQSLDGTVPAQEQARQADNRLSTHIARAREMAERARAEHAWAEPQKPATRGDDQGLDMEKHSSLLEVAAPAHRKGQAPGGEPTVEKD